MRVEVLGAERRRRWGDQKKLDIVMSIVSGQPMALDLKFQGIRVSISVTGQP